MIRIRGDYSGPELVCVARVGNAMGAEAEAGRHDGRGQVGTKTAPTRAQSEQRFMVALGSDAAWQGGRVDRQVPATTVREGAADRRVVSG